MKRLKYSYGASLLFVLASCCRYGGFTGELRPADVRILLSAENVATTYVSSFFVLVSCCRYGGFAGELRPADVQTLLSAEKSNALLVDVRSDEARAKDGVLELKFDARCVCVCVCVCVCG
jgi:hypothetical protein